MQVLAINGSPRGAQGITERILQPFLEGAREAGAKTEVIYLVDKKISHCLGCFTCWAKTPGVCVHQDDMPELLEKVRDAQVMVCATPLHVFSVSGLMKDFMDRCIPLNQPYIIRRGTRYLPPPRYSFPSGAPMKAVLISSGGYPETYHFAGLKETFRRWMDSPDGELAGMICCSGGPLLGIPSLHESLVWYVDAARRAGWEVITAGHISPETQAVLDRPLMENPSVYAHFVNAFWKKLGVELYDPTQDAPQKAPDTTAAIPLPPPTSRDTMRDLVAGMAVIFDPQAAGDLQAVIQFLITGDEPGQYYLEIGRGRCTAYEGRHPKPRLTINTPADVWLAISRGEMSDATAMLQGKYTIEGDLGLLMRFSRLFPRQGG